MVALAQTRHLTPQDVLDVLRKYWDIADYEAFNEWGDISVSANFERPEIYYDKTTKKLYITFPSETEELPSPYNLPELNSLEELKEYIPEDEAEKKIKEVKKLCGGDKECELENAYEILAEEADKEAERIIAEINNTPSKEIEACGTTIRKKPTTYEETRNNGVVEYTAVIPADTYIINTGNITRDQLECAIEWIRQNF